MSRRLSLLVCLSLAAIFFTSFILVRDPSDFARPVFPKPWGASSSESSWMKEHTHVDSASLPQDQLSDKANKPGNAGVADPIDIAIAETPGYHDEVTLEISMIEVGGSHDEVLGALVHSFGAAPNTRVQLYQERQRYGMKAIFDQFKLSNPLPDFIHKSKFSAADSQPTIFVSATCEFDAMEFASQYSALLDKGNTYLFCVIHHADQWTPDRKNSQVLLPWVKAGLADFITLSKHTQDFLDAELAKWRTDGVRARTRHIVPVFPVDLSQTPEAKQDNKDTLAFALQGDYSSGRRDYDGIFEHLSSFLKSPAGGELDVQLHLIGHGPHPQVPKSLSSRVHFDEELQYLQFYGILSRQFALLPAFASDHYLDRKASSSVPASLIAGTPLVTTQAILDAYSYLPADAVWFQEAGETDFDVVGRIIAKTPEERSAKKARVQKANAEHIETNKVLAAEWIREAQTAIRKRKDVDAKAGKIGKAAITATRS